MGCSFSSVVIVPIDGPSGELPCAGERRLVPVGVAMRQRCVSPTKSPTSLADAYDEVARGRGTIVRSCKTIAKLQYLAIVGAVEIIRTDQVFVNSGSDPTGTYLASTDAASTDAAISTDAGNDNS